MNSSPSHSWTPDQWRSISSWALTSWPHRRFAGRRAARPPSSTPSDSDRLCAGSVEITSVRSPTAAQARAVQAATEVFPTPPLPVYRIVRGRMTPRVYGSR